jgi:hypothetical protein
MRISRIITVLGFAKSISSLSRGIQNLSNCFFLPTRKKVTTKVSGSILPYGSIFDTNLKNGHFVACNDKVNFLTNGAEKMTKRFFRYTGCY